MASIRKYVLWGSSGHARVLGEVIALAGGTVTALFDNRNTTSAIEGSPLYVGEAGFLRWFEEQDCPGEVLGLVAIGGGRGRDRIHIQGLFRRAGLIIPVLAHPTAVVSSSAVLGAGSQILAQCNVAADVKLGEACIINHHANVDHECELGNGVHVAPGAILCGCVRVGDDVFIGAGSVVLPRVLIGSGAVIGAGAVVTRDVSAGAVVVGNPARMVKSVGGDTHTA